MRYINRHFIYLFISESRFLPIAYAFDAPVRGVAVGISPSRLVRKN